MTDLTEIVTARAVAKMRHPAGSQLDGDKLSPGERNVLLHALAARRGKLAVRRRELARLLREYSAELESIDRQLSDIEQSEDWLLA